METNDFIYIFTDGSSLNNQKKGKRRGGIGVFFGDDDSRNISISLKETKDSKVTNQVAELLACIKGIEQVITFTSQNTNDKKIILYTDSMYIVNSMIKWAKNWKKNDWKKSNNQTIENKELIIKLYKYYTDLDITFKHVRSHQKAPNKDDPKYKIWYGNQQADKLAVDASLSI